MQILTQEILMRSRKYSILAFIAVATFALLTVSTGLRTAIAASQAAAPPAPVATPQAPMVAAGTPEAMRLLRLMDTDENGKISHAEYTAFMEAEFQRLDINHDGELDLKELEHSQLAVVHRGGTHR
jgi:hypothetical protein